jgi:hypothetical protein
MHRLRIAAMALVLSGCGNRGSVTFNLKTPGNPLLNPVAGANQVSEYDIRTVSGQVIGIASAVKSSQGGTGDLLPLGALTPGAPEDVQVSALSGSNLLGMARIRNVAIKSGATSTYVAELRKPLIFVGSRVPVDQANGTIVPVQILDPLSSTDLAKSSGGSVTVSGGMTAGAVTWDGRFLVAAQGSSLAVFDTGSGQNVSGTQALPFTPARLAVAPRDSALTALDPGNGTDGGLALFSDVAGLTSAPANAARKQIPLTGAAPRTVAFAPDGSHIYLLTGAATLDPCSPGAPSAGNAIVVLGIDGSMQASLKLPSFVADLTVDPDSGDLILADTAARQISRLPSTQTTSSANVTPVRPLGNLTCPSAVRVANGVVFAVTSERDMSQANAFVLQRYSLKTAQSSSLSFVGGQYLVPFVSQPSSDGNIMSVNLQIRPVALSAYELAITPDGSRAQFATRARYSEHGAMFSIGADNCTADFEIAEYGLYALDLRTGNASYQMRAQVPLPPTNGHACMTCGSGFTQQIIDCIGMVGDQPAGLAAVFGQ